MSKYFLSSAGLFTIVTIGSFFSRHDGWYNTYWFTDIILHTISGIALGLVWIGLQKKTEARFTLTLGTISFATFGSVLWEFWEFAGWRLTPAQVPFYIPRLGDTLGDILCGIVGASGVALLYLIFENHRKK